MERADTFTTADRWPAPRLGVSGLIRVWFERQRDRRELERLDNLALLDIGVSRQDVQREIDKPFWRP